ncbi:hypothetical protein HAHE_37380 [Haloferula helveola]|uniref:Fibronectin type-III domain-containing protein n=1 Tax=Haloferula helveola TaxID=490095 RepID=A0ABM7RJ32_9BACT|nr:hypothetical protein HAHE_37380 [Haloferula helveola]
MTQSLPDPRPIRVAAWIPLTLIVALGTAWSQDRDVFFDTSDPGVTKSIPIWGLDLAWLSETHVRRGAIYMGQPQVDVIRCSFTGDTPVAGEDLTGSGLTEFNNRLAIVNAWTDAHTQIYLNNDTVSLHASYQGTNGVDPFAWAELINVTTQKFNTAGRTVVSVAPFNEPDYTTWQGDSTRLGDVCWQLRNTFGADMAGIRLYGASTLNNDQAAPWYDPLNGFGFIEEGCTHQLAGSFDSYAAFFQSVASNGDIGMNDELHNVMEAMVGAEYGMEGGIWWGTAELTRGEFVKASDGQRLGYAEHRPNWTAASVYRAPDGQVLGFVGESERQAVPTTYRFFSKDRPVFYDGYGPQRSYSVTTTGAPGYGTTDHRNAEKMVRITWGEDVQPPVDGRYYLVAKHSGKVLDVNGASMAGGANVQQWAFTGNENQQWDVQPLPSTVGGDYSYFTIRAVHSGQSLDLLNSSYNDGANVIQFGTGAGVNQQWYLEYAGDGYFHIRNRWSGKFLDVNLGGAVSGTANGANVQQWAGSGGANQQWRLIPVGAAVEFAAPAAPANLVATANAVTVDLSWTANGEADLAGYNIYRATDAGGPFDMIARGVTATAFTDESANQPVPYFYKIKAVDESLNRSPYSGTVNATPSGVDTLVTQLGFEGDSDDDSGNANHAEATGGATYGPGWIGSQALVLDGTQSAVLPAEIANHGEITVAAWVRWDGGSDWQRIFDFGNGIEEYLYLSPKAGGGGLRFSIKDGGVEQQLNAPALVTGEWVHLAVTLGPSTSCLYVNGSLADESTAVTLRPSDFKPALNLIGASQFPADPFFDGSIDDFRIYNHALDSSAIASLAGQTTTRAFWTFEDGVAGQAFTPDGQPSGSGGALDTVNSLLLRGFDSNVGPSWTAAAPPNGDGLAMVLADGNRDGYVSGGALHGWSPTQWTIETTVHLEDLTGWRTLIGRDGSSGGVAASDFYLQNNGIDDRFRINFRTVGGARWTLDGNYSPQLGAWYALAVRSDGSTLSMWLDDGNGYQQIGSLDISAQSVADNALALSDFTWTFGRGWFDGNFVDHIDGSMDNIRFSSAALPPEELIALLPIPSAPTGLVAAAASSQSAALSWDSEESALSYRVKRSETEGGPFVTIASGIADTTYEDVGLVPGATYYYVVSAENGTGEGPDSGEQSATTWTPGEEWRFGFFGSISSAGIAGDDEDPDGDGVSNLFERAFGGNPLAADQGLMPSVDPTQPKLSIIYRRAVAATDLTFEVEENTGLAGSWSPAAGSQVTVETVSGVEFIRFTRPAGGEPRLFLRVRVDP